MSSTGVGRRNPRVTPASHPNPIASQINPITKVIPDRLVNSHTVKPKPIKGNTRLFEGRPATTITLVDEVVLDDGEIDRRKCHQCTETHE
jgi:hypothetical protein